MAFTPVMRLNRYWRVIATASAFILFGLGGLILSFLVFPCLQVIYRHNEKKRQYRARKVVHKAFKMFVGYMELVGILKLEIINSDRLKNSKSKIVIANHPSLIDVVVLISIIENADCVVKSGLWKNPFIKGVVSKLGYINNEEDPEKFMQDCKSTFQGGNNLIVFPEGTRTTHNKAMKFRRGAANIAIRAQVDILPIRLSVTPTTLTKELAWYQIPEKRFTFRLEVEEDISVQHYLKKDVVSNSVRELTRDLLEYYNKELKVDERVN